MPTQSRLLFESSKECQECHRALPKNYEKGLCPNCMERELFSRVKEYIRSYDVTEYMVAEEFNIPLSKVRGWIREGRIEYKEIVNAPKKIENIRCTQCGTPIRFGSLCPQCQRKANLSGASTLTLAKDAQRFHTLKNSDDDQA